jgi:hypothetical protein
VDLEAIITGEMAEASIVLMLRAGVVTDDDVSQLADEYDLRAGRQQDQRRGEAFRLVAHRLRVALMHVNPPPAIDPQVEYRAQYERRQMRERTAILERRAREADGGNDQ